jgi:membrane associated rhomboid family serine protease
VSFLSHVFLHAGWIHLLGNLFLLLILGLYLEGAWGSRLFAGFAVLGAVASGGVGSILARNLDFPLIGASGLIAALLGAFAIRFASRADAAYGFVMLTGLVWLGLTAWLDAPWSVAEVPDGLELGLAARASTAMLVGGAIVGVSASALLTLFGAEGSVIHSSKAAKRSQRSTSRLEKALDAQAHGRSQQAFDLLTRALKDDASSPDAALALWDVALSLGRSAEAASAMLRVLRDDVRRGDRQAVVDHWLELDERGLSADADLTLLIRVAGILRQEDQPTAALGALQLALSQANASDSPIVASRVARAAKDLDPDTAEDAAWRALGCVDLDFEERQGLEEMLAELYRSRNIDPRTVGRARSYGQPDRPERVAPVEVPVAHGETPPGDPEPNGRPEPIDLDVGDRALELSVVTPLALEDEGLRVELADGQKRLLRFRSVHAVAVAAVHGLGPKPVILIDLVLNWMSLRDESLKVVRLRGDHFDPHRLCPGHASALEAVRAFLAALIERTGATPLPDANAALGRPFAVIADLASYQSDVLMADVDPVV